MLKNALQLLQNMGFRYVLHRVGYEVSRRTGFLKSRFPVRPDFQEFISRKDWQKLTVRSPDLYLNKVSGSEPRNLQKRVEAFKAGRLTFFGGEEYEVVDWLTNPSTGYRYDATKHWTEIPDFSAEAGDIKYVWEKSRFTFLHDLIRYGVHSKEDQSAIVFGEIESWITANPVNCGPNWRCSQEISLRVLNWTFALDFYKNSPTLTDERFAQILHSVYWQMRHVAAHINFSRYVVRNNHALTETLALYAVGLLYPFFPESERWKKDGKKWFEQEIAYQIYEDGTFLQFSMNYHRVAVQLLTLALDLAHENDESWNGVVYDRAHKSLHFLRICQDETIGWLPNYGNNDGALFFPLTESHFRDFKLQLEALERSLSSVSTPAPWSVSPQTSRRSGSVGPQTTKEPSVSLSVIKDHPSVSLSVVEDHPPTTYDFDDSGYYVLRDAGTLTFLRCGHYKDRPFQADNLHLDIWANGENILRDAGSYLYNTDERWTRYFAGTASHNTVMLGDYDQMRKGPRFIWYDWIRESRAGWLDSAKDVFIFEGQFTGFRQAGKNIVHRRRVTKPAGKLSWVVEDWLENVPLDLPMHQIWHPGNNFFIHYSLNAFDEAGREIAPTETEGWYSETYGQKVAVPRFIFSTHNRYLKTMIKSRIPASDAPVRLSVDEAR